MQELVGDSLLNTENERFLQMHGKTYKCISTTRSGRRSSCEQKDMENSFKISGNYCQLNDLDMSLADPTK